MTNDKQRERLVELLKLPSNCMPNAECKSCGLNGVCTVHQQANQLLANGVIVPPCKVGQTVYQIQLNRNRVQAYEVIAHKFNGRNYFFSWVLKDRKGFYENVEGFSDIEIGKTVFLTKEEAEAKLKEGVQG